MGIGAWERQPQGSERLVIAIPHTGLVTFEWAAALKMLQPPCPFNFVTNKGLPIDRARCDLVEQAQQSKASHIFFLDSDVIMHPLGLLQLWNRRLPVVTGIYGSKIGAPGVWIEQQKSGQGRYQAVAPDFLQKFPLFSHPGMVVGGGCCLIDLQIFSRLKAPFFYWTQGREQDGVSEDFYFFEKCREAGIPVHVDTSVQCLHAEFAARNWKGELQRLVL